jgi:hypothetical protein
MAGAPLRWWRGEGWATRHPWLVAERRVGHPPDTHSAFPVSSVTGLAASAIVNAADAVSIAISTSTATRHLAMMGA